jgi:hypothetical protein
MPRIGGSGGATRLEAFVVPPLQRAKGGAATLGFFAEPRNWSQHKPAPVPRPFNPSAFSYPESLPQVGGNRHLSLPIYLCPSHS